MQPLSINPTRRTDLAPHVVAQVTLSYWACQLLGWGLNATAQAYSAAGNLHPLNRLVLEVVAINSVALLLSHMLRIFMKQHGWHALGLRALLPRILLVSILLGFSLAAPMQFMAISTLWTGSPEEQQALDELGRWLLSVDPLILRTINWSTVFLVWIVLYFGLTSLRDRHLVELRQSELTRALQLAELRLLKSQLNPHFLFNCLNSVRALIADDPAGAQKAVTQLARTLRYTLSAGQEEIVTLERELEIVADYLELESLRLGDRLTVERNVAVEARGTHIPVMLLQTVVENAIKHGIAELPQGGVLRICATMRDNALSIEVENPRPRPAKVTPFAGRIERASATFDQRTSSPGRAPSPGVGLHNAAERLRLLFGTSAMLEVDLSEPERALARIRIPQPA